MERLLEAKGQIKEEMKTRLDEPDLPDLRLPWVGSLKSCFERAIYKELNVNRDPLHHQLGHPVRPLYSL